MRRHLLSTFRHPQSCRRLLWLPLLLLLCIGCSPTDIDSSYGHRRGNPGAESVNGTAVLSELFRRGGYRVATWRRLSPKLDEFDVIVWFPDEFAPPSAAAREFLENWLASGSDRVLVYVGRDYDAGIAYWEAMLPDAPPDQLMEVARRLATRQADYDNRRAAAGSTDNGGWFAIDRDVARRRVESLSGPWSVGIDAGATDIELASRITFPEAESELWEDRGRSLRELLTSDGDVLAAEITGANRNRIMVVANGSFLLNLPLVQPENRKLAARLVDASGRPGGRRVAFLETGPSGPLILDQEPDQNYPTGLELFTVWPLGIIVLHLTAMGILCCFALFPIFGRPRETPVGPGDPSGSYATTLVTLHEGESPVRAVRAHFGKHIEALGKLLERTGDRRYAVERVKYYHEHVKRDSGGKPPSEA